MVKSKTKLPDRVPRGKMIPDGFVKCPHCGAGWGMMCQTPSGRDVLPPHVVRMEKAFKKYGLIHTKRLKVERKS